LNGVFQSALMADRDEKRFDVGTCSQNGTDYFLVVLQQGKATFLKRRFCEAADKSAFCAADCGSVEEKAQMSGYTKPTRMRDALAIDNEHIGTAAEFFN